MSHLPTDSEITAVVMQLARCRAAVFAERKRFSDQGRLVYNSQLDAWPAYEKAQAALDRLVDDIPVEQIA